MAENKKSVILYCDTIHTFEALEDAEAGKLIKHFLRYVNDLNPTAPDKLTQIAFEPIKQQLKRDLQKWETIIEKRSEAGKASANKRQQIATNSTHVESVQQKATKATVSVTDTVNVNVSVTDAVIHPFIFLIKNKLINVYKMKTQITFDECVTLEKKYGSVAVENILMQMENKKDLTKKYTSVYLTANTWLSRNGNGGNGIEAKTTEQLISEKGFGNLHD
jgi:hypothetical protein